MASREQQGRWGRINRLEVPGGPNCWRWGTGKNELDDQEVESMSLGFYQYKGIILYVLSTTVHAVC